MFSPRNGGLVNQGCYMLAVSTRDTLGSMEWSCKDLHLWYWNWGVRESKDVLLGEHVSSCSQIFTSILEYLSTLHLHSGHFSISHQPHQKFHSIHSLHSSARVKHQPSPERPRGRRWRWKMWRSKSSRTAPPEASPLSPSPRRCENVPLAIGSYGHWPQM